MPSIHLTTFIAAPISRVFDLTRNLTLHKVSLQGRKETFTSGAGSNLVGHGETMTFLAKHFGKTRMMMVRITEMKKPDFYKEEQVKGDLQRFNHEHHFKPADNGTIVIDILDFEGPRDFLGRVAGKIYLKAYFEKLIIKRNAIIKQYAETEKWRAVLTL